MRKVLQARGDPCRVPVLLLFHYLFIAVGGFSLWRGGGRCVTATGVLQMFVVRTNLVDFRLAW